MGEENKDQLFVASIIREIVNNPDKVVVNRTVDELGVLLSVKVDASDMGLLIGRSGSTAKAIRTLARIVGMRNNSRVNMKIEEPEGGRVVRENPTSSGVYQNHPRTPAPEKTGLDDFDPSR